MVSKAQKTRLGIFVLVSSSLLILMIIVIAGNKLMEKRDTYYVAYNDVSVNGLQIGGAVKYHGINVGRVEDISIDEKDITRIIVKISVAAGTPIKSDVEAILVLVGITGLKQIEIKGGTNEAKNILPDSYIKAGASTLDSITGKAEIIAQKAEKVLNNIALLTDADNRESIARIIKNFDYLINENKQTISNILRNTDSLSYHVSLLAEGSAEAIQKVNDFMDSDNMNIISSNLAEFSKDLSASEVDLLVAEIKNVSQNTSITIKNLNRLISSSRRDLVPALESLRETIDYLNEFARQIGEDPSLLIRSKKK